MTTAQPDPIAEDLRAIELASVATSIAKAAQPGQEQRMVTDAMIEAAAKALWKADRYGYQNDSTDGPQSFDDHDTNGKANYREMARAALEAARPTADLGDDGEFAAKLRAEADALGPLHLADTPRFLREAADRIELYREALVAARPYVEANASRDSRMTAHHKGADVLDMIDAVLSRSGG